MRFPVAGQPAFGSVEIWNPYDKRQNYHGVIVRVNKPDNYDRLGFDSVITHTHPTGAGSGIVRRGQSPLAKAATQFLQEGRLNASSWRHFVRMLVPVIQDSGLDLPDEDRQSALAILQSDRPEVSVTRDGQWAILGHADDRPLHKVLQERNGLKVLNPRTRLSGLADRLHRMPVVGSWLQRRDETRFATEQARKPE